MPSSNSVLPLPPVPSLSLPLSSFANPSESSIVSSFIRNNQLYKIVEPKWTAIYHSKMGTLIEKIINVKGAGVYSVAQTTAFQVSLTQPEATNAYLVILWNAFTIPIPAVLVLICVTNIALQPPSADVDENQSFFFMILSIMSCVGCASANTMGNFFPELQFCFWSLLLIGITFGTTFTLSTYILGHLIGFPVPFVGTYPVMPAFVTIFFVINRITRGSFETLSNATERFVDYTKFQVVVLMTITIFPILSVLSAQAERPFFVFLMSISFPISKLVLRYIVHHTVNRSNAHLDLASKMSIFTVEFFSSMYLAMMLRSGVTIWITGSIIVFDVLFNTVSAWKLYHIVKQLPRGIWNTTCTDPKMSKLRSKVLHISEYMLLSEYIECMVPLMYLLWMWNAIKGPNRQYWFGLQSHEFSHQQAITVSYSLLFLFLLEFISLLSLMIILKWKCNMPIFRQLVFILRKDWGAIAAPLTYMLINAVLTQMEHFGYDYTFQFKWLYNN